jgi:hypothetical protein
MLLMLKPTFSHSSSKKYSEFGEMNFLLDWVNSNVNKNILMCVTNNFSNLFQVSFMWVQVKHLQNLEVKSWNFKAIENNTNTYSIWLTSKFHAVLLLMFILWHW